MGCGPTYGPHANCKFGDTFIGKIGCQYDGKVLKPASQQPVTCQETTTWCCPCGYSNGGNATRACGLYESFPRPWSTHYEQENLLPANYMSMTVSDWADAGWYTTEQDYKWCNIGGRCVELCTDGHDCTEGGCNGYSTPTSNCSAQPSPPTPSPPSPPGKRCDWQTAVVTCTADRDCAAWVKEHCTSQPPSQHYCKPNKSCHFSM